MVYVCLYVYVSDGVGECLCLWKCEDVCRGVCAEVVLAGLCIYLRR